MNNFSGTTLAFSHRDRVWRTRYSFTPTAYGYVDNFMISANGRSEDSDADTATSDLESNVLWLHDSNEVHNNFYGANYRTEMSFVSNYNPSSNKIFKSISAETNDKTIQCLVETNNNLTITEGSTITDEYQSSLITKFKRKEGAAYSQILSSKLNSTAHISAAFTATEGVTYDILNESDISTIPSISPNSILSWTVGIDKQYGQIPVGENCFVVVKTSDAFKYIKANSLVTVNDTVTSSLLVDESRGYAYISGFDPDTQTVEISMRIDDNTYQDWPFSWLNDDSITSNFLSIAHPVETNGDFMRGKYLSCSIFSDSKEPVEFFAFNVNYENTKLDHSLGQNS